MISKIAASTEKTVSEKAEHQFFEMDAIEKMENNAYCKFISLCHLRALWTCAYYIRTLAARVGMTQALPTSTSQ